MPGPAADRHRYTIITLALQSEFILKSRSKIMTIFRTRIFRLISLVLPCHYIRPPAAIINHDIIQPHQPCRAISANAGEKRKVQKQQKPSYLCNHLQLSHIHNQCQPTRSTTAPFPRPLSAQPLPQSYSTATCSMPPSACASSVHRW